MARYSLFVLKVLLNNNKPNQTGHNHRDRYNADPTATNTVQ